jgi:hypothetical protein
MNELRWQMIMENVPIRGGAILNVVRRGKTDAGYFVMLSEPQSSTQAEFWLDGHVNIGGKDYLLLRDNNRTDGELVIVCVMDKDRYIAMDPDRFSSLANALSLYRESRAGQKSEAFD